MKRRIGLIIGDGFTKDFIGKSVDTSRPLHNFGSESVSKYYDFFKSEVKEIHDELLYLMSEHGINNEFDAINLFMEINRNDIRKECRLRRYLALSYSSLQIELDRKDKSTWRWYQWLNTLRDDLTFSISFNYDLLLETTLEQCKIQFYRTGSTETHNGLPVFKPHGSIDFDIQQPQHLNVLEQMKLSPMIWSIATSLNQVNGVVVAIPSTHWLLPRFEADIIPPSQENYQRHLKWVDKGFQSFEKVSNDLTDIIIIGHSYSVCDRPEIDYFLEKINPKSIVHIVNPQIIGDLEKKLKSLKLEYTRTTDLNSLPLS